MIPNSHHLRTIRTRLLFTAVFFIASAAWAPAAERVIVRNDSAPLERDFEVGRFGAGRLYFDDPLDLVVDGEENVYILDAGNYRVQVMDDRQDHEATWGSRGEGDGQFDEPVAMALDHDERHLLVLDKEHGRVIKFDLEGNFITSFGEQGHGRGKLDEPADLAVDTRGYVYVVDEDRGMVLKYHRSGTLIEEWGQRGRSEKRLQVPVSIAYSDELLGAVYVLDAGDNSLVKFETDGEFVERIPLVPDVLEEAELIRIEADEDDNLFILDAMHGKLIKLNRYGIGVFTLRSDDAPLYNPAGLALDEDERVYVTDLKKDRIFRYILEMD